MRPMRRPMRSCLRKYEHLFAHSAGDPHHADLARYCQGWCPHCIGICARRTCLQEARGGGAAAAAAAEGAGAGAAADEEGRRRLLAMHLVQALSAPAAEIMRLGEEAAADAGTTPGALRMVESGATATHPVRVLCNRCATCIEDVHYSCGACDQDFCCRCAKEAAGGTWRVAAPTGGGGRGGSKSLPWCSSRISLIAQTSWKAAAG